jgi:hypothetical protein
MRGKSLLDSGSNPLAELLGGMAQAQSLQPFPGDVEIDARIRGAHRATSAHAA